APTPPARPCPEKPRSAPIEGSATSTMVASRSTMKKAPQRSASAHQRRGSGPVRGAVASMSPPEVAEIEPSMGQTPQRRETGRPPTAQFAPRPVSVLKMDVRQGAGSRGREDRKSGGLGK